MTARASSSATKTIYLVSGEISGDTHGAGLMRELRALDPGIEFRGAGGDAMLGIAGEGNLKNWVEDAAVVGVWEVLKNYGYFRKEFRRMLDDIEKVQPDAVILIDYPGFNLRLAKAIRARGIPTKILYYISPQVWAWHRSRIPRMAEMLDLMICIFPFEKELYEKSGLKTTFAGHPMVDKLREDEGNVVRERDLAALLPGSREREIRKLFPVMVEAAKQIKGKHPEIRFMTAAVSKKLRERMREILREAGCEEDFCEIRIGGAHDLMQRAQIGVVASGTATLEAGFYGLPYCLVYKVAAPTYHLGKWLVQVDHLGMVNILAGREIVKEFIQKEASSGNIATELLRLLESEEARTQLTKDLEDAVAQLGEGGAYRRAAAAVFDALGWVDNRG